MATRSAIAMMIDGEMSCRYVHLDGDQVGIEVQKIIERDGVRNATDWLFHSNGGWKTISADSDLPGGRIGGYGEPLKDGFPEFLTLNECRDLGCEYVHFVCGGKVKTEGLWPIGHVKPEPIAAIRWRDGTTTTKNGTTPT